MLSFQWVLKKMAHFWFSVALFMFLSSLYPSLRSLSEDQDDFIKIGWQEVHQLNATEFGIWCFFRDDLRFCNRSNLPGG